MAYYSVAQISALINQQIQSREALREYLLKAESLTRIALDGSLFNCPERAIHSYMWILSDLVDYANKLNDQELSRLLTY